MSHETMRPPHKVWGTFWLVWCTYLIASVLWDLPRTWFWLAFAAGEGSAVLLHNGGLRDTLSEGVTWAVRQLQGHKPEARSFARGWNAFLMAFVILLSYAFTTDLIRKGMPMIVSIAVGMLVVVWLYDHWEAPDIYG